MPSNYGNRLARTQAKRARQSILEEISVTNELTEVAAELSGLRNSPIGNFDRQLLHISDELPLGDDGVSSDSNTSEDNELNTISDNETTEPDIREFLINWSTEHNIN